MLTSDKLKSFLVTSCIQRAVKLFDAKEREFLAPGEARMEHDMLIEVFAYVDMDFPKWIELNVDPRARDMLYYGKDANQFGNRQIYGLPK